MSNVLYPLSLIQKLVAEKFDRTVADEFEDGSASTRYTWTAQYFKRRFRIYHSVLTPAEWRYLRSFYSQRNGLYDAFWFRDNVNRDGNASVRFATRLQYEFEGSARMPIIDLAEVAAIRALPEWDEMTSAAGTAPLLWFDANREIYYTHAGTAYSGETAAYDSMLAYPAAWQAGALSLGGTASQYQTYNFTGTNWARSSANVALVGTQPAATLFCIAKHSATTTKQVLFSLGATSAGAALSLAIAADGRYEPWIGGSETWTNARLNNSAADTFRSLAVVWAGSSNNATLYANGASVGTDAVARSLTAGPFALGGSPSGTLLANAGAAMANCSVAHVLIFAGALTLNQVKAVHNLLAYQYGLSTVS